MKYAPKNFKHLLGIEGLSDKLLENHFGLYEGYVSSTNAVVEKLRKLSDEGNAGTPEFAELTRRFGWEFDGMRLHEYYFSNLTKEKKALDKGTRLYKKLEADYGSFGAWAENFKAVGGMRGIGWIVLYYDPQSQRLFNVWINEHDGGHFAGCVPVLVMDVFEHAFMLDYGTKKADYIKTFFGAINWEVVSGRYADLCLAVK